MPKLLLMRQASQTNRLLTASKGVVTDNPLTGTFSLLRTHAHCPISAVHSAEQFVQLSVGSADTCHTPLTTLSIRQRDRVLYFNAAIHRTQQYHSMLSGVVGPPSHWISGDDILIIQHSYMNMHLQAHTRKNVLQEKDCIYNPSPRNTNQHSHAFGNEGISCFSSCFLLLRRFSEIISRRSDSQSLISRIRTNNTYC